MATAARPRGVRYSTALRIAVPPEVWRYFEVVRDRVRLQSPNVPLPAGALGTRRAIRAWIEAQLEELAGRLK